MKNAVFWYMKTQFIPHRKHITSSLQSPVCKCYVRFEVFTEATLKNSVFWDIKAQFIPHRKHIISATDPSRLMLCKIGGLHGGDYKERRLLWYKNPVLVAQETHYVSVTEPSLLNYVTLKFSRRCIRRMPYSGIWYRLGLVRRYVFGGTYRLHLQGGKNQRAW
jgi:hypothetical protein